jgi:hypothetical protein
MVRYQPRSMERVVYILGAGFSAPLGIPTVRNFIEKARDLYFGDPGRYGHFKDVLTDITNLSRTSVMFKTPQYDLEEVLSILQAEQEFGKTSDAHERKDAFVRLIADVVNDSALPLPAPISTGNWRGYVTASGDWQNYITFVASLFRLQFILSSGLPAATQLGHGLQLR